MEKYSAVAAEIAVDARPVFVKGYGNFDRDVNSRLSAIGTPNEDGEPYWGEPMTVQSQKEEADINTIVKNFGLTGMVKQRLTPPLETEFADVFDFRSAMDLIVAAERAFMDQPADVRKRFGNDPAEFVSFASNPENAEECRKLGLWNQIVTPPPEVITKVQVVNPPPDDSPAAK